MKDENPVSLQENKHIEDSREQFKDLERKTSRPESFWREDSPPENVEYLAEVPTEMSRYTVEFTKDGVDVHLDFSWAIDPVNSYLKAWCVPTFRTDVQEGWFSSPECTGHDGRESVSEGHPCDIKRTLEGAAFDAHWAPSFNKSEMSQKIANILQWVSLPDAEIYSNFNAAANSYIEAKNLEGSR
jgi:hypothetical protein